MKVNVEPRIDFHDDFGRFEDLVGLLNRNRGGLQRHRLPTPPP